MNINFITEIANADGLKLWNDPTLRDGEEFIDENGEVFRLIITNNGTHCQAYVGAYDEHGDFEEA